MLIVGLLVVVVAGGACASPDDPGEAGPEPTVSPGALSEPTISPGTPPTAESSTFTATPPASGDIVVEWSIEFMEWMVGCVAENGHVVEVIPGDPPALDHISRGADRVVNLCRETAIEEGWFVASPFDGSAEANRLVYPLYLEVHECLRDNGYPTVDPPSEEAFVDQGTRLWNPYSGFPAGTPLAVRDRSSVSASQARQLEAQELCGAGQAGLYQRHLQDQQGAGD